MRNTRKDTYLELVLYHMDVAVGCFQGQDALGMQKRLVLQ